MNSKKNEWEYLLKGNPQVLRELSRTRGSSYFQIYEVVNHHLDCSIDDFRMKSIYCNNEDDLDVVWQVGYELVSLFNGAACLQDNDFWKIGIEKIWKDNTEVAWRGKIDVVGLLGKPYLNYREIQEEHRKSWLEDIRFGMLNLATENQDIYLILKYFDMEADWVNYYKILETVESFASSEGFDLNILPAERKSFTNVANNFSLSSLGSRHGFKQAIKSNKTNAMTLAQAHIFIRIISKNYIKSKYNKSSSQ